MDEHKEKRHKKVSMDNLVLWTAVLLGAVLLVTNVVAFNLRMDLEKAEAIAREQLRPAKIELTVIKNSKCTDCFDISATVSAIKGAKANVTKETSVEFNSKEAKDLISKYQLQKIPTVIVTGELDKFSMDGLEKKEDALILADVPAPYTAAGSGKIEGMVKAYYLKDSSCSQCAELNTLIEQIKASGMKISEQKTYEASSSEGKQLAEKYKISHVPSLVLSKEASSYPAIAQAWSQVGTVEDDGSYVLRIVYPPFKNLTSNEIKGIVDIIYLSDESCSECYDVNQHKEILTSPQSYGLKFGKEEKVDISSAKGKELIGKYGITLVPTIILSKDVAVYPGSASLAQFFSIEDDGSYVFIQLDAVGVHKNLETGEVVQPAQQ